MESRGLSPVAMDCSLGSWTLETTAPLLGGWHSSGKWVTHALVSTLTITLMPVEQSVILNVHHVRGKCILKYQSTDLFPRVKNSASFCRKRSRPGPEGPPPLLPDPHHSSPGVTLLASYSSACSQTLGSHSTESHSHLVSSFLTQHGVCESKDVTF